jgi:hypothetical protein
MLLLDSTSTMVWVFIWHCSGTAPSLSFLGTPLQPAIKGMLHRKPCSYSFGTAQLVPSGVILMITRMSSANSIGITVADIERSPARSGKSSSARDTKPQLVVPPSLRVSDLGSLRTLRHMEARLREPKIGP